MSALKQAAQQALEALEDIGMKHHENTCEVLHRDVYEALKAALAEPVQEQPICDECGRKKADGWALYCVDCMKPVFAPPQRKPLTGQEYADVYEQCADWDDFARAIERAHGIGGQP